MKIMNEFPVGENQYKPRQMLPKTQLHVVRRMTPFIVGMLGQLPKAAITAALSEDKKTVDLDKIISTIDPMAMITPILENMATMPDKDVDFIIDTCMEHCDRAIGNGAGWSALKKPGQPMQFMDIELIPMLQITWNVIQQNVGNFFPVPSLNTNEPQATA